MAPKPQQWRSLEQLADTPAFQRFLQTEFGAVSHLAAGPERRQFLRLMAASFALAGLAGCDERPDSRSQKVPWVNQPEHAVTSDAMHYASVALLDGFANGVLVTTRNGRPLKIEGNPQHPWSRGGTDIFAQASVLDMYDPGRSQTVRHLDEGSSWQAFRGAILGRFAALRAGGGKGFRLLTGPIGSPSLRAQIADMQRKFPRMHWHSYAAADRSGPVYAAAKAAFGRELETRWRFDRARVLVALEGDFLDPGPQQAGVSRDWIAARAASAQAGALLPMYSAGSLPNLTSAKADHAVVATPAELHGLAMGLLADLSGGAAPAANAGGSPVEMWRAQVAAALHANRGAGLVIAGSTAPVAVQEAVHRLNAALGNTGQTVFYTAPVLERGKPIADLAAAMRSGAVSTLVMLDSNPAYDAPGGLNFADALSRVALKIHAGSFVDETALHSDWHTPLTHPLESWGDGRSLDGTVGLMQPAIAPLYEGRSPAEFLSLLADPAPKSGLDLLRGYWQGSGTAEAFEPKWQAMLQAGFIAGSALPEVSVTPTAPGAPAPPPATALSVAFRPDPTVWDGRAGNNGWLQELPKPLTKITWDNAVAIAPALAAREGLRTGDVVTVSVDGAEIDGPVWVMPGQADRVIGLTLGYGRSAPDMLSTGAGYNATVLRGNDDPWSVSAASLRKTGRTSPFATTQDHNTMEGHDFVRVQHEGEAPVGETQSWTQPTMYTPPRQDNGTAWGMVIDLDACIGCNACVVACQAENNIAVVGREQVALGREMHWLRVDRYYEGPVEAPKTHFQPVPCMNCEQAPCEVGCPVEATLHDGEGLNVMVYNRCVGTRACSGYCPYKVRRFNYLDYAGGAAPVLTLRNNPEVSIRSRGVMEKCTYCIQRIEAARIDADKRDGSIADGVVQTACQGACPTRAISFGDLHDTQSAVAAARADSRNYALLGELNVRPRTTYLAERAPRRTDGTAG